jgi:hypothetical protein
LRIIRKKELMMATSHSAHSVTPRYDEIIANLARVEDIRALSLPALHLVMTMRLCDQLERAERDPLTDLATRFQSVAAARAALNLADKVAQFWPSRYRPARPCSLGMTPDEATLAAVVRAALACDRAACNRALQGFVRAERHAALYDAAVHAVAMLQQPRSQNWREAH